ncbi:hypothetical protein JCM8547_000181 [Rhodosporidiobolus lusitaniae]
MAMRVRRTQLPSELVSWTRPLISRSFSRPLSSSSRRLASNDKSYYVTTPIFYVNADPHVGHLHSTLLADVYARYARLREPARGAVMCTGTDEHGLKIQRVAEAKGISPKALCDGVSERFRDLAAAGGMDHQVFIRTTEGRHRTAVEHVWRELQKRGYIYKSSYAGWYAVSDEAYVPEGQIGEVIDPKSGEKYMASTETGTRVEWMEEENYKFRLSAFREPILKWLQSDPSPVQPPSRSTALVSSLLQPTTTDLNDLSISRPRSRLSWGIPVPDDPDHTIYVWIDALVNYLTAAGYPWKGGEAFAECKVWPPDLQVVGKDIIRFHALYLPAILMALELPLTKHLLTHGHWTMDKFKMSKSRGNVANPFEAMKLWGTDAMRMYLMRIGGNSASDADYSATEIERFYRKDLAGQMGNLLNRIANKKLLKKLDKPELIYTMPTELEEEDAELLKMLEELPTTFSSHIATFEVHRALSAVFDVLSTSNKHVQLLSPWLPTASPSDAHRALFFGSESLRLVGILLQPFMPTKAKQLLDSLGVPEGRRRWVDAVVGKGGEREVKIGGKTYLWPSIAVPEPVAGTTATRSDLPLSFSSFLVFALLASSPSRTAARTTSYDDTDDLLDYYPSSRWSTVDGLSEDDWQGGGAATATRAGARLRVTFAGEQISLYGTSSLPFNASINGGNTTSFTPSSSSSSSTSAANATEPVRIFLATGLSRTEVQTLELVTTGSGRLLLDRVAVAYSSDTDLVPTLLTNGVSGAVSTATLSATSTSSPSAASTSSISTDSASSSSASSSKSDDKGIGSGVVAAIILPIIAAVALAVFLFFYIRRRRRSSSESFSPPTAFSEYKDKNRSSYINHETGRRRSTPSTFLSALNFSRSNSGLPSFSRNNSNPSTTAVNGGVGSSPPAARHPFAATARNSDLLSAPRPSTGDSSTSASGGNWASRLTRAASWKKKADRLESTREFYGVPEEAAVVACSRPPPPQGPLPSVPCPGGGAGKNSEERVMEERWRTEGPSLVAGGLRAPSRAAAAAGEGSAHTTVQVYGEAMSEYSPSDEAEPSTPGVSGRRSFGSAGAHLRRRSLRQEEPSVPNSTSGATFMFPLNRKDLPLPPPPVARGSSDTKKRETIFRNPFSSTSSAGHGSHHSVDSGNSPLPGERFSVDTDADGYASSRASAEQAHIHTAQPISVPPPGQGITLDQTRTLTHPDDVSLYSMQTTMIPLRMGSLKELQRSGSLGRRPSARGGGGEGRPGSPEVVKPAKALARRPTLTRSGSTVVQGKASPAPLSSPREEDEQGGQVDGYVEELEDKHRSVAGLIETMESFHDELDGVEETGRKRRDPRPGEEDRSAYFSQRERMPRYEAGARRDPRRAARSDGSISRR